VLSSIPVIFWNAFGVPFCFAVSKRENFASRCRIKYKSGEDDILPCDMKIICPCMEGYQPPDFSSLLPVYRISAVFGVYYFSAVDTAVDGVVIGVKAVCVINIVDIAVIRRTDKIV